MDKRQVAALIKELAAERDNLDQAIQFLSSRFLSPSYQQLKSLVTSQLAGKKRGRPRKAELTTKPSTKLSTKSASKASTKRAKRKISDEARKKMSDAAKRRHAARRKQSANA